MTDLNTCSGLEGLADDLELPPPFTVGGGSRQEISNGGAAHPPADMPDFFFPHFDQLPAHDSATTTTQMTDLTNSLPRRNSTTSSSLSAQAILAKLDCSDLNSSLNQTAHDNQHRGLDTAELFGGVYDDQYDASSVQQVTKPLEPTDVYGRVTCYDGKIVLQLRLLNLNTNFPINVSECWMCRNKVHGGSQMYAHKHMFQGIFQVNDEYVHLIIPEPEPELDKSVFHTSFDQSTDFTRNINSTADLDFREEAMDSEDNFNLPYIAKAFGMDDKILNNRQDSSSQTGSFNKVYNSNHIPSNSGTAAHDIHTAVDNIYNKCNTNAGSSRHNSMNNSRAMVNDTQSSKPMHTENTFLHSLQTIPTDKTQSPDFQPKISNNSSINSQDHPVKRTETGAKKRKSKAQKKPSVIRMKEDSPSDDVHFHVETQKGTQDGDVLSTEDHSSVELSHPLRSAAAKSMEQKAGNVTQSNSNCADTTLLQRSQKQLDANYNLVKRIIAKTEDVTCKICQERFGRNMEGYKQHMVNKHGESEKSIYECPICVKKFGLNKHLVQHVKSHLGIKAFKCDKCGTTYGREESLKRHLMTHAQKRPHVCSVCPKTFGRAEYLAAHMQAHNRTRHVCEKCGVVCSSKFNLDIHLRKHSKEKPFVCELCNKSFVRSDFLDNHMEVVHKRNKPKCNICGKLFSRKDVLKRHMTTHKKGAFDCKFCLRSFTRKDRLLAHKRTHEVNNELKCFKCPAAFHRREVLLKHQRLHETKEQCHICFKFATSKEKLLVHLTWHEKEANNPDSSSKAGHTCETCGKTLTRRDLLRKHIRRVHGRPASKDDEEHDRSNPASAVATAKRKKQFVCDICNKGFTRSCNLRTHVLKLHSSKPDNLDDDEDDPDDLDSLNSALNKSRQRQSQSNLVDLSSWTMKRHNMSESYVHQLASSGCLSSSFPGTSTPSSSAAGGHHSLLAVASSNPSVMDSSKENCAAAWYPRSGSASPAAPPLPPPHLAGSLALPQLASQHPHSPINLSAEAITAAAYLLAYPSYLGPYQ